MAKTINLYEQLKEPKHRKGYYLTLEPAFDIIPDSKDVDPKTGYNIKKKTPLVGSYDVCLYHSGKLCLSPFDYYREHKKDSHKIERLKENEKVVIPKFETIIKEIIMQYEDEQIITTINEPDVFNYEPGIKTNFIKYIHNAQLEGIYPWTFEHRLILLGKENLNEAFQSYWLRDYEGHHVFDNKYTNVDLSIFLLKEKTDFGEMSVNSKLETELEGISELKISNPSHGFKIRFNKLDDVIKAVLDKHI